MPVTFHDFVERKATTMRIIYKLVSKWALRRALLGRPRCRHWPEKGRFDATNMDHIYEQAWRNFDMLSGDVPEALTVGNKMNLMLACLSLSAFRALMAASGTTRGAGHLVGKRLLPFRLLFSFRPQ